MTKKEILEKYKFDYQVKLIGLEIDLKYLEGFDENLIYGAVPVKDGIFRKDGIRNITIKEQKERIKASIEEVKKRLTIIEEMLVK